MSVLHGRCDTRPSCLPSYASTKLYCLVTEAPVCKQLVEGHCASHCLKVCRDQELSYRSQVQHLNCYATEQRGSGVLNAVLHVTTGCQHDQHQHHNTEN